MAGFFLFHFEDWPIINKNLIVLTKNSTERSLSNWKVYFSKPAKNAAILCQQNLFKNNFVHVTNTSEWFGADLDPNPYPDFTYS